MQERLPKLVRKPEEFQSRQIGTECDLDIIAAIARYNLLPTSSLRQLVTGNERHIDRRLQVLFHQGIINRFPLRYVGGTEFCYNLHNREALDLLVRFGKTDTSELDWDQVRQNRDNPFTGVKRLLFVDHELVISRFHATLELACRRSHGAVELLTWRQGPRLHNSVVVSKLIDDREHEGLPHRPDAFLTLRFRDTTGQQQCSHFFYEADRATTHAGRMKQKFRAHFQYVVKQELHRRDYKVHPIRAVLFEAPAGARMDDLSAWASDEIVSGPKPSRLFWFTSSELFTQTKPQQDGKKPLPRFLHQPEFIFVRSGSPSTTHGVVSFIRNHAFMHAVPIGRSAINDATITLHAEDRAKHMAVLGKSGVGKTTLMRNMIVADLYAGAGLTVIDPHGSLVADVLENAAAVAHQRRDLPQSADAR